MLGTWGPAGVVDTLDLLEVLGTWNPADDRLAGSTGVPASATLPARFLGSQR